MGNINGFTISINKVNKSGYTDNFLEPLVLNESFLIRICCFFETPNAVLPYLIQLDIFSRKTTLVIMESHMLIIMEFLSLIKNKSKLDNDKQNDNNVIESDCIPIIPSIPSKITSYLIFF